MGRLFDWFGSSRKEIWRKLSAELDARYSDARGGRIDVDHGPWTITLDTYTVMAGNTPLHFTRFRAPFRNQEKLRLRIYRSSVFSTIGKWFGLQDIEVGSLQFDADFIVRGSDEALVRRFCGNAKLRQALMAQRSIQLTVADGEGWFSKIPPDVDLLTVAVSGHLEDKARIAELFDLFALALDQLCEIGAAYAAAPGHEL